MTYLSVTTVLLTHTSSYVSERYVIAFFLGEFNVLDCEVQESLLQKHRNSSFVDISYIMYSKMYYDSWRLINMTSLDQRVRSQILLS